MAAGENEGDGSGDGDTDVGTGREEGDTMEDAVGTGEAGVLDGLGEAAGLGTVALWLGVGESMGDTEKIGDIFGDTGDTIGDTNSVTILSLILLFFVTNPEGTKTC